MISEPTLEAREEPTVSEAVRAFCDGARHALSVLLVAGCALASVSCGSGRSSTSQAVPAPDGGAPTWGTPGTTLPSRSEVLVLAHTTEGRAVQEGHGAIAYELHRDAARLLERAYRGFGKEQDGKEASDILVGASKDRSLAPALACDAAIAGARLAGEVARDPVVTYRELHRGEKRLTGGGADGSEKGAAADAKVSAGWRACAATFAAAKHEIEAFRPPRAVLDAIEQGVTSEGDLPARGSVPVAVNPPRVQRIDAWPGQDATRVVVEIDRPVTFRVGDEALPGGRGARTFVELDGVQAPATSRDTPLTGVVARVASMATTTGSRVVLDLDGPGYRRVFHLLEPYRIVIDVARKAAGPAGRRNISRVLLDPGHGGADPGAIGPAGLHEADVTVDIARRAAKALAQDGVTVVVTRDSDKTVSLEERAALANSSAADLFISIHCNAADNHNKRGIETYVLDTGSDVVANRVAARENATSVAASSEIGSILTSLRLSDQSTSSTRLAELMQRAALASLRPTYPEVHDGGLHRAGFYVLVGARMPSILFESSYISNADEEAKLRDEGYRQRLAEGVANAVRAYREGR